MFVAQTPEAVCCREVGRYTRVARSDGKRHGNLGWSQRPHRTHRACPEALGGSGLSGRERRVRAGRARGGARAPSSVSGARADAGPPRGRALRGAHAPRLRSAPLGRWAARLTGSGALHGAGARGSSVPAAGRRAQRPGAGRGSGGRGAGPGAAGGGLSSGRGEPACVGPEPREPQAPQEMHAGAGARKERKGPPRRTRGIRVRVRGLGEAGPRLGHPPLHPPLSRSSPAGPLQPCAALSPFPRPGLSRPTPGGVTSGDPAESISWPRGLLRIPVFSFAKSFQNTDL